MTRYSSQRDMTHVQPSGGGGTDTRIKYAVCGCQKRRHKGDVWLGRSPIRCAECAQKKGNP